MANPNAREFDKLVHHRDGKTGKIVRTTPYKLHVTKKGALYHQNGEYFHPNGDVCKEPWKILDSLKKPEKKLSTEPKKKTLLCRKGPNLWFLRKAMLSMALFQRNVRVEPVTITTSGAYALGDQIGDDLNFAGVRDNEEIAGSSLISVSVLDPVGADAALDIFLFDQAVTEAGDNAAASVSIADLANCIGLVQITAGDYASTGATSVATVQTDLAIKARDGQTSVTALVVSRGTPNYAANDLIIKFGLDLA